MRLNYLLLDTGNAAESPFVIAMNRAGIKGQPFWQSLNDAALLIATPMIL